MAFGAETAQLQVRIDLAGNASQGIGRLQKQVSGLGKSVGRAGKGVGQIGAGFAKAGLVVGGAVIAGLGAAAKTAIEFEDAFAGVKKTVEGSPKEIAALNDSLRKLSTRIPVDFTDLAGIAQEAGALGVPTKNVAGFTEVVARLSAATVGLTASAAAEAFGKLGNVLKIKTVKAFEQLGSALVALGNAGASSEGDIVEVAKRFGAAGAQARLSAAQVLGFSSAIASMGVEPEAAGSSLSRLFNNITKYIGTGDKKVVEFAKVTKLSVANFRKLFAKDASGAVQLFLKNLSKLDRFTAAKVLKKAGITNVRDINAVLLLARGHDELARQVKLSTDAYRKNVDLAEVSKKRFDTLKSRIIEFKNAIKLAGVTIADGFLPALGRAVEKLRTFLDNKGTQDSLKNLGEEIGKAIDGIDWQAVLDGAKQLTGLLQGALSWAKLLFNAVNALPGPLKEAAAGFLVVNKLSGGLLGSGVGNLIGGIGETIAKSAGSRLPGVGKLFAQPVFVTNWPLGGLGGGANLPGKAGNPLKTVAALGVAGLIVGAAVPIGKAFASALPASFKGPGGAGQSESQRRISEALALIAQRLPKSAPPGHEPGRPTTPRGGGSAPPGHDSATRAIADLKPPIGKTTDAVTSLRDSAVPKIGETTTAVQTVKDAIDTRVAAAQGATELASRTNASGHSVTQSTVRSSSYSNASIIAGATRGSAQSIIAAIYAARPIINVTNVTRSTTIQQRYGPGNGSSGSDGLSTSTGH